MMNDYVEDLDDFPAEHRETPAESLVGAYRAESTAAGSKWNHNKDSTSY